MGLTLSAILFTLKLGLMTALVVALIGAACSSAWMRMTRSWRRVMAVLFLIPCFVPTLFSVLGLLTMWSDFPFGFGGIMIGTVWVNVGLAIVMLGDARVTLAQKYEASLSLMPSRPWLMWKKVWFPGLLPSLLSVTAVVFSLVLVSFVMPLSLSSDFQKNTLEVLLYAKLSTQADFQSAAWIAAAQLALQLVVFIMAWRVFQSENQVPSSADGSDLLQKPSFFAGFIMTLLAFLLLVPYGSLLSDGAQKLLDHPGLLNLWANSFIMSFIVATLVTVMTVGFGIWIADRGWFFLKKVPAPSSVVIGFVILFAMRGHLMSFKAEVAWISIGQTFFFMPALFRLVEPRLKDLHEQYEPVIKLQGLGLWQRLWRVKIPLSAQSLKLTAIFAWCWSVGEFAIARLCGAEQKTAAVVIQDLMGSYRLEEAAALTLALCLAMVAFMLAVEALQFGLARKYSRTV